MAKKKRKAGKKHSRRRSRPKPPVETSSPFFDPRAMEGLMHQFVADLGGGPKDTALDRAQQLMYEAFEAEGRQQVALARRALEICPDCADAFVLLAEHAATLDEAVDLYRQGVSAGERAIGEKEFQEFQGHFWGLLETRPYMRAREGLARCLWQSGRRQEAVDHYREMLGLNPGDNQGIRYVLASALLDLGRNEDLGRLLKQYEDETSTDWTYTTALLAFRQEGDSQRACKLLADAKQFNPHVPDYLLGNKPLPRELPGYHGFGDENEAVCYVAEYLRGWKDTPGAVSWLRKVLKVPLPRRSKRRTPSWPRRRLALAELPQAMEEVWEADVRRAPPTADDTGAEARPWLVYVTCPTDDAILGFDARAARPGTTELWEQLTQAMLEPEQGEPHRPQEIRVRLKTLWSAWKAKLRQIGVECLLCDGLDHVDRLRKESLAACGTDRPRTVPREALDADHGPDVSALPQRLGEVWQADVRRLPTWVGSEGQPQRPWCALVSNRTEDLILAHNLTLEPPSSDWLWESIQRAIVQPAAGQPHRPGVIEVGSADRRESLRSRLEAIDVQCVVREELDQLDFLFDDMAKHLAGPNAMPALVDVPGVEPRHVGAFFQAAAEFYRKRPWRDVPGDTPIRVECDKFQSGPWYALVMGQMGMTLGLSMYEDLDVVRAILRADASDEENARRMSALSMTYGEAFEMAPGDLDAAERHGWQVAGPEAYPCAMRINPGQTVRPPLAWELELLTGCLRAIPDFLHHEGPSATRTVPAVSGELTLRLSWSD